MSEERGDGDTAEPTFGEPEETGEPADAGLATVAAERDEDRAPAPVPEPAGASLDERGAGPGDTLGRALELVDELRGLLPAVAGAAGVDPGGAIAALTSARDEADRLDGQALERAEAAVSAARERPREIDALLGLSGNLDALAAVLEANRRYAAAVEQAIGYLGGRSGAGQGPATSDDSRDR